MTALVLQQAGYAVVCAANAVEALMLYGSYGGRLDAVLTDVDMPGMNGLELAARIQAADPGARILIMTGCLPPGASMPCRCRAIAKPFRPNELLSMVREVLAG